MKPNRITLLPVKMGDAFGSLQIAIRSRFTLKKERIELFISPDRSIAVVLSDPYIGLKDSTKIGFYYRNCGCKDWKSIFLKGIGGLKLAFHLHERYFPQIPLHRQFVRADVWDFRKETWQSWHP